MATTRSTSCRCPASRCSAATGRPPGGAPRPPNEGYAREGADVFPAWRLRGLALVAAHDGRGSRQARRLATEGLDLALASGDLALEVYHRHILGFVALSTGDVHEADAQLTAAERAATASGTLHPGRFKIDADRLEAALAVGDTERAAAILDGSSTPRSVAPTPWTLRSARAGAASSRRPGRRRGALGSFNRALVAHERLPMPFERARTLLALGAGPSPAQGEAPGRRAPARGPQDLRSARRAALGRSSAAELARVGLRPRASHDLTETERRVAELAATRHDEPADRRTGVPGPEDRRQCARAGLREARDPLPGRARRADGGGATSATDRGNHPFHRVAPGLRSARWTATPSTQPQTQTFLVERYWPGVDEAIARTVVANLERAARAMTAEGTPVEHVGSILMPADEVVFSLIEAADERRRTPGERTGRRPARPDRDRHHVPFAESLKGDPMSSKHRFAAILSLGRRARRLHHGPAPAPSGSAPPSVPIAVVPPPASAIVPPPSSLRASTGPSASPDASGAQPTPGSIDPCTLLTQAEASTLMGKSLGAGVSTTWPDRVCTFKSGLSEVKVFITPPASDPATANAFYDDARSSVPADVKIDDISIPPFARAGYGSGSAQGVSVSGLVVVDGNVSFEVYCGFPACGETASALAATQIGGRLP